MRSGLTSSIAALALVVALGGCDEIRRMTGTEPPAANTVTGNTSSASSGPALSAPAAPGGTPAKPVTTDPALAAEVADGVVSARAALPMRIDEVTEVVGIRADGTEFVYDVQISQPLPGDRLDTMRQSFQTQSQARICANPQTAAFIRRGGSMSHRYSDTTGFRFETRVVSC